MNSNNPVSQNHLSIYESLNFLIKHYNLCCCFKIFVTPKIKKILIESCIYCLPLFLGCCLTLTYIFPDYAFIMLGNAMISNCRNLKILTYFRNVILFYLQPPPAWWLLHSALILLRSLLYIYCLFLTFILHSFWLLHHQFVRNRKTWKSPKINRSFPTLWNPKWRIFSRLN